MTRTPPPEPRPPTILGTYGEGYCRYCHFIEPLDHRGLIEYHNRGIGNVIEPGCKGSGTRPPRVTPYASRLAAFRVSPPSATCPVCGTTQDLHTYLSGPTMARHWTNGGADLCRGVGRRPDPPPGRDHGSERG
jgi:hypothetical protein